MTHFSKKLNRIYAFVGLLLGSIGKASNNKILSIAYSIAGFSLLFVPPLHYYGTDYKLVTNEGEYVHTGEVQKTSTFRIEVLQGILHSV